MNGDVEVCRTDTAKGISLSFGEVDQLLQKCCSSRLKIYLEIMAGIMVHLSTRANRPHMANDKPVQV